MIANDKSLHFYMELKRKESSLTYALRVDVACTLMAALCEPDRHQGVTHSTFSREKAVASGNQLMVLNSTMVPTMQEFISGLDVNGAQNGDDKNDEICDVDHMRFPTDFLLGFVIHNFILGGRVSFFQI
ncbi:Hypothetical predicted protein [Olea europaea subsp. europaea]|uniref:Uncharacterized protein n=1 Tax=Olea europaea subsp. europaea TaxID=158383 RepID=A0A8S0V782_OLEEU|nr:Hypothetical predicted protein [Olea europaea subsp. europaea]